MRLFGLILLTAAVGWTQNAAFTQWANQQAQQQLAQRAALIASIQTVSGADARKTQVDQLLRSLIGQLPATGGPLNAQITGTIDRGAFRIERLIFESLPGLRVPADVYVPTGSGPFPAVLVQIGHYENGKAEAQLLASNLALKGFVALAFDPIGQAERLQGFNTQTNTPLAVWGVEQHLLVGGQAVLMGHNLARYMIFDAQRALDYLTSRTDVDATRIGATGCSGGGTLTTYLAALDSRVKAAAPACAASTQSVLLSLGLVGDSEQSIANFISSGLDLPDLAEQFAPRPLLVLGTQQDNPSGPQAFYDEARRWYGIYGATGRIAISIGPGGHGTPLESRQAIYGWMVRWLKNNVGDAAEQAVALLPDSNLLASATGQVGGSDLFQIIRTTTRTPGTLTALLDEVRQLVRYTPGTATQFGADIDRGAYIARSVSYESEPGVLVPATLLLPKTAGVKPAAVYLETTALESNAAVQLALSGVIVLDVLTRGFPRGDGGGYSGEWYTANLAWLIGRNLPAMRAKDLLHGLDILGTTSNVDPTRIAIHAQGATGVSALLASALDARVASLVLDRTPYSFEPALNSAVHTDLHTAAIPGFFLRWDLGHLVSAMGRRKVIWTNPTDWSGQLVPQSATAPRLTGVIVAKGPQGNQYFVDLTITNTGPGTALNASIDSLALRVLGGSGAVSHASALPFSLGDLAAGASLTRRILLNVPATVTRFSLTEGGALTNGIGSSLTYSTSQVIIR